MPKKILLADDSITIQKVIGLTFANEDVVLTVVDNGDEAIAKLQGADVFDLCILDFDMPGKTGGDVLTFIRQEPKFDVMPVVFLTGSPNSKLQEELLERGADDFIAGAFGDGHGLAGDHGFVQVAAALEHLAVGRHPLARAQCAGARAIEGARRLARGGCRLAACEAGGDRVPGVELGDAALARHPAPHPPRPRETEAWRWTQSGGLVRLGDLPGGLIRGSASGASADGARGVGLRA